MRALSHYFCAQLHTFGKLRTTTNTYNTTTYTYGIEFELYRVKKTTMHRNIFLLLITFSLMSSAVAQEHTLELTLEETIEQARQQSPDAQNARHSFRSAYWNYKYYCANYLPTLKLTSNPYLQV